MPNPDLLQGWKEIAAYVSRDVSTAKRWEKQRGVPGSTPEVPPATVMLFC